MIIAGSGSCGAAWALAASAGATLASGTAGAGASRAILVTYLVPAVAVFYGAVFLGEPVTASALGGLALILGGALGNLWDRLLNGRVVDFLLFYIGQYQWPAFNVADSAIVVGAGLLVIEILFTKSPIHETSA